MEIGCRGRRHCRLAVVQTDVAEPRAQARDPRRAVRSIKRRKVESAERRSHREQVDDGVVGHAVVPELRQLLERVRRQRRRRDRVRSGNVLCRDSNCDLGAVDAKQTGFQ